jgi:hypothetical protein
LSSTLITTVLLEACSNDKQKAELNKILPQYSTISMDKVGHKEDEGAISYSELEPKKSYFNCASVLVQGIFGVLLHSGDYVLVDEMVARNVTVSDTQVEVYEFPRVVEDASKGWEPICQYLR